jgi:L-ribulose-5-phosphate 3-epimerase
VLKGLSIWALKDHDTRTAESLFAEARAHGFDGVEVAVGEGGLIPLTATEQDCARVLQAARSADMVLTGLASGLGWQYPLTADDEEVRRKGSGAIRRSLELAAWLGVDALLVVPGMLAPLGGTEKGHVPYDVVVERMREGLAALVPVAEELGVTMAVENVWNRVLLSPLEMRDFIDSFGSPQVGSYLDVGNMILFGYAEDWIRILGGRIARVHFKDFKRDVGTLAGFCDLLDGDVDYPAVMQALREVGYDGACVAELFGLDEEGLQKLSAAMDSILAMV